MKERIKETAGTFFIVVTCVNIAMLILGKLFMPDQLFGYEVFIYPVIYGLIGSIPGLFMDFKKEMSISQVIVKKLIMLAVIVTAILALMFGGATSDKRKIVMMASVAASIVVIYVLVNLIEWWLDLKTADSMMSDLAKYKSRGNEE